MLPGLFHNVPWKPGDVFSMLITQDESWVGLFTVMHSLKHNPCNGSICTHCLQRKHVPNPRLAYSVFRDQHRVVLTNFLAKGTTINGTCYASLLRKLWEAIKAKRHGMLNKGVRHMQDKCPSSQLTSCPDWQHAAAGFKFYRIPLIHPISHHQTYTSFQQWSHS